MYLSVNVRCSSYAEIIHAANKCNNCALNSIRANANANGRLLSLLSPCRPSGRDKAGDTFLHTFVGAQRYQMHL